MSAGSQCALKTIEDERAEIRDYDPSFTREQATRLGRLSSRKWMLACLVRTVAEMKPFARRKSFVDDFQKHHGEKEAGKLINGLKEARK